MSLGELENRFDTAREYLEDGATETLANAMLPSLLLCSGNELDTGVIRRNPLLCIRAYGEACGVACGCLDVCCAFIMCVIAALVIIFSWWLGGWIWIPIQEESWYYDICMDDATMNLCSLSADCTIDENLTDCFNLFGENYTSCENGTFVRTEYRVEYEFSGGYYLIGPLAFVADILDVSAIFLCLCKIRRIQFAGLVLYHPIDHSPAGTTIVSLPIIGLLFCIPWKIQAAGEGVQVGATVPFSLCDVCLCICGLFCLAIFAIILAEGYPFERDEQRHLLVDGERENYDPDCILYEYDNLSCFTYVTAMEDDLREFMVGNCKSQKWDDPYVEVALAVGTSSALAALGCCACIPCLFNTLITSGILGDKMQALARGKRNPYMDTGAILKSSEDEDL